jgi:hypothetical protein
MEPAKGELPKETFSVWNLPKESCPKKLSRHNAKGALPSVIFQDVNAKGELPKAIFTI